MAQTETQTATTVQPKEMIATFAKMVNDWQASNKSAVGNDSPTTFNAKVKLYCKDRGHTHNGSHEVFKIDSTWSYGDLCQNLKDDFKKIHDGPINIRRNVDNNCYWSNKHEVTSIKAIWVPGLQEDSDSWASMVPTGDVTIITEHNCQNVLDMMKPVIAPTLSVTIRVRGED